jgi:hypothetical protein
VRIVVLVKPVPDRTGTRRLGPGLHLDRASAPTVVDPNDGHADLRVVGDLFEVVPVLAAQLRARQG